MREIKEKEILAYSKQHLLISVSPYFLFFFCSLPANEAFHETHASSSRCHDW